MAKLRKCVVYVLILLLLTGCTQPRVLTDLPDGEIVERVKLQDGYLRFIDGTYLRGGEWSIDVEYLDLPSDAVVGHLGFDPIEMSLTLPEKFRLTEDSLEPVKRGLSPPYKMPFGGYVFSRKGDPGEYATEKHTIYPEFRIILKRVTEEERNIKTIYMPMHRAYSRFGTLSWELWGVNEKDREKYHGEWRSEIGEYEVSVLHDVEYGGLFFPGVEWDYFYGGFYVGDLSVCIESKYGYCTQAEFVEVFLAIFDYLTALEG